jgi:transposase
MEYYAGIDVSLESSSICVVDTTGRIVREAKVASEPEALTAWCKALALILRGSDWKLARFHNGCLPA